MTIIESLTSICNEEWDFFGNSKIHLDGTSQIGRSEYDEGAWQRVGHYWQSLGTSYAHLTGKDRGWAWSAAFVSFCMKNAGAGRLFPYSASHSRYINYAIAQSSNPESPLIAHRIAEYVPRVGDLIGRWRGIQVVTFDNAVSLGNYESHTDIVVATKPGVIEVIGGNVLHSVTRQELMSDSEGHLSDKRQAWFVVIENRLA